jgi:SAM-dependent methyltransferase
MNSDSRILSELEHGKWVAAYGEEVWNWSSPAGRIRWARRVALFRDFIGTSPGKVLEVGCGTGLFTAELALTGYSITAIDISPELLAKAAERVVGRNVTFAVENAYHTTFLAGTFDVVLGSSCLHHFDLNRALAEFHRILKPGGRMMFTEPNMLNPQVALQKNIPWLKRLAGDSPDETAFIRFSLESRLQRAGFRDISIMPFDFVHPAIPVSALATIVPILNAVEHIPLLREIAGSLVIRCRRG